MSTYILAIGSIECSDNTPVEVLDNVVDTLENTKGIYNIHQVPLIIDKAPCRMVEFQMEGVNGVDYTPLESLIPSFEALTGGVTIEMTEYMCTESGFYYDSEE